MIELQKILRNRLRPRRSKKYVVWFGQNKVRLGHAHHILESVHNLKLNDYFLVDKTAEAHQAIHYKGQTENEFLTDFLNSLEGLLDYVEYLENRK